MTVDSPTSTSSSGGGFNTRLDTAFSAAKAKGEAAFVGFVTAGYPSKEDTVELMLAMQEGGTSVIELGVPYTDPQADGATIQLTNQIAIKGGTESIKDVLKFVKEARARGLTIPVVLMGYYNPFFQYGIEQLTADTAAAGGDGFIVVDLPPEEGAGFVNKCAKHKLSYIPLIAPTSTDERVKYLLESASSFVYCVSVTGVTGSRTELPADLTDFVSRIRKQTELPLAVGFGIGNPSQVNQVAEIGDGVVVGSAILNAVDKAGENASPQERAKACREFVADMVTGAKQKGAINQATVIGKTPEAEAPEADESRFGEFGGQFIPETLSEAFREIDVEYKKLKNDPDFQAEVLKYRKEFVGGPTPLHLAPRLTEYAGGANIWLKREDLAHTGAHKINNAIGQALLAKKLGKNRIIAETGAGQHGVATATACALMGLECIVYMGAVDMERQALNVFRMKMMGAKVMPAESGSKTLKDAINEAMRDWVTNIRTTHYIIGSAVGPHPFPDIVRDLQAVIGTEARAQMLNDTKSEVGHSTFTTGPGRLPDYVVACVGGGSNAIGMFSAFLDDEKVKIIGVEAGGEAGPPMPDGSGSERHSATLTAGTPGVLHGSRTYLIQDKQGQIIETHSISAGLDYPGVGPQHAALKDSGRVEYVSVPDSQALDALQTLSRNEGIIPALEPP